MALKELLNTYNIAKNKAYWIQEALVEVNVLEETVTFAFEGTDKERIRAYWILYHMSDRKPVLLLGFVGKMMDTKAAVAPRVYGITIAYRMVGVQRISPRTGINLRNSYRIRQRRGEKPRR